VAKKQHDDNEIERELCRGKGKKKKRKIKKHGGKSKKYKVQFICSNPISKAAGRKNMSKPGQTNNPNGRPKGSISIVGAIKKILAQPDHEDNTINVAQRLALVAAERAQAGDFKFWQSLMERTDGKVPDHLVIQKTQEMVEQEAAAIAGIVTEIILPLADEYIEDDEDRAAFITDLAEQLAAKFADEDEDEDDDE